MPRASNTLRCTSGRVIRMDPPPISVPVRITAPALRLAHPPHEALRAERLGLLGELVEALARDLAPDLEAAHHAALLERAREDLELRPREHRAEVVDLHADTPVRAVGAVAEQGLVVGDPLERHLDVDAPDGEHV